MRINAEQGLDLSTFSFLAHHAQYPLSAVADIHLSRAPPTEYPTVPEYSTPIKTEAEPGADVKEPPAEEVVAPASEPPSRAEEQAETAEAATEPVDAVTETPTVVPAADTVVEVEAPVELDETAASASGELTKGLFCCRQRLSRCL